MKKLLLLFLITNHSSLISQIQFQRAVGGNGVDIAQSIVQTTDGGYAVAGYTQSFGTGNYDFYIIKLSSSGTLQWSRTVGGMGNDRAYSIIQTTDGGYAVAGVTTSFGAGMEDMYVVKLDAGGIPQWNKTVGGTNIDEALSIVQTSDGGYTAAGVTRSFGAGVYDVCMIKLDNSGNLQWSKTVGGTGEDVCWSMIQTTDGGYALAGETGSFGAGSIDMYIVKLNGSGALVWSRTIGGVSNDYAYSIIQTTDGGYVMSGKTNSFGAGGYDFYIVKLDSTGTLQWTKTVGGISDDIVYSIKRTTDSGYIVAGQTNSFGAGLGDIYIVKLDGGGTVQWSRIVGGANNDDAQCVIQTSDGGYAVTGGTYSFGAGGGDYYIVKFDANGNTCSNISTPSPTTSTGGTLTTICTFNSIQPISSEFPNSYQLYQNYPNPFNPKTKFKIQIAKLSDTRVTVYDVLGREVEILVNQQLQAGTYEVEWNSSNYSSGVYYYKLMTDEYTETKKMLLIK